MSIGFLLMDTADGDLFNLFSEDWGSAFKIGLENEAKSNSHLRPQVDNDSPPDRFFAKAWPNLVGTLLEPLVLPGPCLESTRPFSKSMHCGLTHPTTRSQLSTSIRSDDEHSGPH